MINREFFVSNKHLNERNGEGGFDSFNLSSPILFVFIQQLVWVPAGRTGTRNTLCSTLSSKLIPIKNLFFIHSVIVLKSKQRPAYQELRLSWVWVEAWNQPAEQRTDVQDGVDDGNKNLRKYFKSILKTRKINYITTKAQRWYFVARASERTKSNKKGDRSTDNLARLKLGRGRECASQWHLGIARAHELYFCRFVSSFQV